VAGFVGRLINPHVAVLRLLDTDAIREAGHYDDEFQEIVLIDSDADGIGEEQRAESGETKVPAQIATRRFEFNEQGPDGRVPQTDALELTFHFRDLGRLGLVQSNGRASIQPGTRLVRVEAADGTVIWDFPDPPGMFVLACRPSGFLGPRANLLVCTLADRQQDTMITPPRGRQN